MKARKVWRYYCEYCKKSGCSKFHLRKHEERCTKNPNRVCGYCKLLDKEQPNMADLLSILPNPKEYLHIEIFPDGTQGQYYDACLDTGVEQVLPRLRAATANCPACIMAALRQKGIPVPLAQNFNFTKECQEIWDEINAGKLKRELAGERY